MDDQKRLVDMPEYKELEKLIVPFFDKHVHEPFETGQQMFDSWVLLENPMLGGVSPVDMLMLGRGEKLIKICKQALSENKPDEPTEE